MPDYRKQDDTPTTADDPKRLMWYAANSYCGYWTDDWSKLKRTRTHIPCCPECGYVGMQCTVGSWESGAKIYEERQHPHYLEYLAQAKEKCLRKSGTGFMEEYNKFVAEKST